MGIFDGSGIERDCEELSRQNKAEIMKEKEERAARALANAAHSHGPGPTFEEQARFEAELAKEQAERNRIAAEQARQDYLQQIRNEAIRAVDLEEAINAERERRRRRGPLNPPKDEKATKLMQKFCMLRDTANWTIADRNAAYDVIEKHGDLDKARLEINTLRRDALIMEGRRELERKTVEGHPKHQNYLTPEPKVRAEAEFKEPAETTTSDPVGRPA